MVTPIQFEPPSDRDRGPKRPISRPSIGAGALADRRADALIHKRMQNATNRPNNPGTLLKAGAAGGKPMATHSSKLTVRAKWRRGWALMWAGKTSEGYDLLAGITVADLPMVGDGDQPESLLARVQSIVDGQSLTEADQRCSVIEILIRAAKQGDEEASELLVFGDLSSKWGWPDVTPAAISTD